MRPAIAIIAVVAALLVTACEEEKIAEAPPPAQIDREATGYYCSMTVVDHRGPKGQIILASKAEPLWFTAVRDTIAFTLLPEEAKDIAAIYVTDMARASEWDHPEKAGPWIEARTAWFVVGSDKRGGMGAPEAVPFGSREAAEAFAAEHGGRAYAFADIPHDAILGTTGDEPDKPQDGPPDQPMSMNHDQGHKQ
jgi:copper chaperone NosL